MSVVQRVWVLAEPLAQEAGLEIVDAEFRREGRGQVLRVFLDRVGGTEAETAARGVTLDELSQFSRQLSDLIDVNGAVPGAYTIEASSPGINRRLRVPAHFARYVGRRVRIRTSEAVDGGRTFVGVLRAVDDDGVVLGDAPGEHRIAFGMMAQANYEHDFAKR